MVNLTTTYLGFKLKNPIIIGSSGLTSSVKNVKKLENAGAAAVVLKSIFEEEILHEYNYLISNAEENGMSPEQLDYFDVRIKNQNIETYKKLISDCKNETSFPVFASINCVSAHEWPYFAKEIEKAGADALELNLHLSPSNTEFSSADYEKIYFEILEKVKNQIKIPVALKISPYQANLAQLVKKFSEKGANGTVLFNRFYNPDFDIDNFTLTQTNVLSSPSDFGKVLRWVSLLSGKFETDICATTGIHSRKSVIKQLLAGAKAVQIASVIYVDGVTVIEKMLKELSQWMENHHFERIDDFIGKMSQNKTTHPEIFERTQFMKYFSDKNVPNL